MTTATGLRRTPQQTRSQRALDAILDATIELLIEGHRLEDLTMSTIATRAGISKAAIYRYYPDRPTIIRAVAEHYLPHVEDRVAAVFGHSGIEAAASSYRELILADPVPRAIWVTGYSYAEYGRFLADVERRIAKAMTPADPPQKILRSYLRNARAAAELELLDTSDLEAVA